MTLNPSPMNDPLARTFTGVNAEKNLGKVVACALGYEGREGGWIYRDGTPICQGYVALVGRCSTYRTETGGLRLSDRTIERFAARRTLRQAADAGVKLEIDA